MQFSVLMPVYAAETAERLMNSLKSVLDQSFPPDEIVLVCDGPLTLSLNRLISRLLDDCAGVFNIIRLEKNVGIGTALSVGLLSCKYELVARMDSDDICAPERFKLQIEAFECNPDLSVCGGQIIEFSESPDHPEGIRVVPLTHDDIQRYAKSRNPFNHMTVMFKRSAILGAGNYAPMPLFEDYYLWMRILKAGYKVENLPDVLVYARAGASMLSRRGGLSYFKEFARYEKILYREKLIPLYSLFWMCTVRLFVSVAPLSVRRFFYRKFLRRKSSELTELLIT